jgi:hypothetical protein
VGLFLARVLGASLGFRVCWCVFLRGLFRVSGVFWGVCWVGVLRGKFGSLFGVSIVFWVFDGGSTVLWVSCGFFVGA